MKSFVENPIGIVTFRALPHPLPAHTQELLKASGAHLAARRLASRDQHDADRSGVGARGSARGRASMGR